MTTQTFTRTLITVECASCSMTFGVTEHFNTERRNDHARFYCPKGHHNFYPQKSEEERLREQLKWARTSETRWKDNYNASERSKAAIKGHLTRARNKIAQGVCPAPGCGQHFSNVREHMKHKHPDYHLEDPETGKQI